ncbi:haloacid dehalogenase [Defluviimonas sp. 20V17]|uniref:Haloacid dehalogenase n=1 Tax=Allgaiera indica TaxID=765699 RepID=A0AAN5A087_9RHOB|nr:HAD family phosphatase [Allgaiera indica]KDB02640.1 haloacid dehalogenase [Defluviimonas sp. 20V17]GHE01718.1 haloacid dehalogenase [Allgaiera indica]SDW94751.1 2-haloacid dehalogenase [Allgaiera indica]
MNIRAVVFDIGNVLIEWQPHRHFDRKFGKPARMEMFTATNPLALHEAWDRGANFRTIVHDHAKRYPDFAEMILCWHDDWLEIVGPEIPGSIKLLRALRAKGIPVLALSNFGVENFALTENRYLCLTEFDRRYISGHLGTAKPDARIYEMVEADCGADWGIAPGQLLFTDDRPENITAAATRGWATHLFQGPGGLADRLVRDGLLTEKEAGQE